MDLICRRDSSFRPGRMNHLYNVHNSDEKKEIENEKLFQLKIE